jgi:hypothetical protein
MHEVGNQNEGGDGMRVRSRRRTDLKPRKGRSPQQEDARLAVRRTAEVRHLVVQVRRGRGREEEVVTDCAAIVGGKGVRWRGHLEP